MTNPIMFEAFREFSTVIVRETDADYFKGEVLCAVNNTLMHAREKSRAVYYVNQMGKFYGYKVDSRMRDENRLPVMEESPYEIAWHPLRRPTTSNWWDPAPVKSCYAVIFHNSVYWQPGLRQDGHLAVETAMRLHERLQQSYYVNNGSLGDVPFTVMPVGTQVLERWLGLPSELELIHQVWDKEEQKWRNA